MDQFLVDGDLVWEFHGLGKESVLRGFGGRWPRRTHEFIVDFDASKNQANAC